MNVTCNSLLSLCLRMITLIRVAQLTPRPFVPSFVCFFRPTCGNIRAVRKRPAHPTSVRLSLRLCLFIPSLPSIFLTIHPSATVVCSHHRACIPRSSVCLHARPQRVVTYLPVCLHTCMYLHVCVCVCVLYVCDVTNLHLEEPITFIVFFI